MGRATREGVSDARGAAREGGEGRRTMDFALAASGFAVMSACTTATDVLLSAAM